MPPGNGKTTVKNEEVSGSDEDEGRSIASVFGKAKVARNNHADQKSQPGARKIAKRVKKEENGGASEQPNSKEAGSRTVNSVQKKEVVVVETKVVKKSGKGDESKEAQKRVRKVYDLPGQKRDPPEERDPLRIFYATLYEQVPGSQMAAIWMMESGLLPLEEANKVYQRTHNKPLTSPAKASVLRKTTSTSTTTTKKSAESEPKTTASLSASKQQKKRKSKDESSGEDDDDDLTLSTRRSKKPRAS